MTPTRGAECWYGDQQAPGGLDKVNAELQGWDGGGGPRAYVRFSLPDGWDWFCGSHSNWDCLGSSAEAIGSASGKLSAACFAFAWTGPGAATCTISAGRVSLSANAISAIGYCADSRSIDDADCSAALGRVGLDFVARRVVIAIGRLGSILGEGSEDAVRLYQAYVEATEEYIQNVLWPTISGGGAEEDEPSSDERED